jgi:hypothetical protein
MLVILIILFVFLNLFYLCIMLVLVYGSNGWIGNQFVEILKENNIDYVCGKSRVDNEIELNNELQTVAPTHVVSFIGRTHGKIGSKTYTTIDYLEEEGKLYENVRDNLFSPLILAEICSKQQIHFTYLGTVAYLNLTKNILLVKKKMVLPKTLNPIFSGLLIQLLKVLLID